MLRYVIVNTLNKGDNIIIIIIMFIFIWVSEQLNVSKAPRNVSWSCIFLRHTASVLDSSDKRSEKISY